MPGDISPKDRKKLQAVIDAQYQELVQSRHPKTPFRWRYQLGYLGWLAGQLSGLAFSAHGRVAGCAAAVLAVVVTLAVARGAKDATARAHTQLQVLNTACWMMLYTFAGAGWWVAAGLLSWAVPWAFWCRHYRWTGPAPGAEPVAGPAEIFARLAERKKWAARLGPPKDIPHGRQYPIVCDGALTNIGNITGCPREIAAAFSAPVTEAYAEPDPSGIEDRGILTLLRASPLDEPRRWAGGSIDPATGLAVAGRFPDGMDVHERIFVPGVGGGTKHSIVGGADGSGKTGKLDLGMCVSVTSGVVCPVILDPQEGQALPSWQDHVTYAKGVDACLAYLRALHSAMFARSAQMSATRWCRRHVRLEGACPDDGQCKIRKGMGWFDPYVTGLPVIEIIIDEAPVLLAISGVPEIVLDLAKLGRKTGFRLVLAAQVPSVSELGKSELRSILVGGNVFGLRTGDKVSSGMLNIEAKLNEIPKVFRNMAPTVGLGYASTVEMRPGVLMRLDWIEDPDEVAGHASYRGFDPVVAAKVAEVLAGQEARAADLARAADDAASLQLRVLAALSGPMKIGELLASLPGLKSSEIMETVEGLVSAGKARKAGGVIEKVGP